MYKDIEQFKSALKDWFTDDPDRVFSEEYFWGEVAQENFSDGTQVNFVEQEGGEGQGDMYHSVYSFSNNEYEVYVKFYGYYSSYGGSEYQGFSFVTPKEKKITVYE